MGLLSLLAYFLIFAITCIILFLYYQNWKHAKYFRDKGVTYLGAGLGRTIGFVRGNVSIHDAELTLYDQARSTGKPFVGFNDSFVAPLFYIVDLDLMKHIYVKDFDHFVNRRAFGTNKSDKLLRRMMISLESEHWKGMRSKLSPTFTTGKIRRMFGVFDKSSQAMCTYIRKQLGSSGGDFEVCDAYSKYAMDVIASCAFGIDSKCFTNPAGVMSQFEDMAQRFQFKFKASMFLKFMFILVVPKLADALGVEVFETEPQEYFIRVIKEVLKRRRETGERQDDFLQLMVDVQQGLLKEEENSKEAIEVMTGGGDDASGKAAFANKDSSDKLILDDDDIVANCVMFLIGGFDTTQSLLIFTAYQLAREQEVQERLYEEVKSSFEANKGKLTYEGVLHMNYLDMFINETLRYFPPPARTERRCTKDYKIPGTDVVIEKDTIVALPILGLHRDPKYYPNPERFDPTRWESDRKSERHPYAFSPFGQGPRNCIGLRFALTEVKAVVATLVYNFKLEPCGRTEIPMKYSSSTALKPLNGLWLKMTPRRAVNTEE